MASSSAEERVQLPFREYLLFEGPVAAVTGFFNYGSPNLWWPDDRAWCVATDIDLDSAYVGGSAALIRDLLDDRRIEVVQVNADDVRGDTINASV